MTASPRKVGYTKKRHNLHNPVRAELVEAHKTLRQAQGKRENGGCYSAQYTQILTFLVLACPA